MALTDKQLEHHTQLWLAKLAEGGSKMHYEIGRHSNDEQWCHVALVDGDERDELFDVQLYGDESDSEESIRYRGESLAALETLVARANETMWMLTTSGDIDTSTEG